jgi:DNA-binding MarR family transcriptional regulator
MMNDTKSMHAREQLRTLAAFRYELRKFMSFSEMATDRRGIATQQYQLMQVIAALPEGQQASISYLADRMVLRHNSTVELVDRAEKAGLVRRHPDENDLRRSLVQLTEQGEGVLHELVAEHLKDLVPRCDALIAALQDLRGAAMDEPGLVGQGEQ